MTPAQKLIAVAQDAIAPEFAIDAFEGNARWPTLQNLSVPVRVKIPLLPLRLAELKTLAPGMILASEWAAAEEVPLFAAEVALSWCEFAVLEGLMAVRLTRIG